MQLAKCKGLRASPNAHTIYCSDSHKAFPCSASCITRLAALPNSVIWTIDTVLPSSSHWTDQVAHTPTFVYLSHSNHSSALSQKCVLVQNQCVSHPPCHFQDQWRHPKCHNSSTHIHASSPQEQQTTELLLSFSLRNVSNQESLPTFSNGGGMHLW